MGFNVAVGVQEMVVGDKSFVMFTCDPTTAAKNTIITAGYGAGEGVVQEKVAVDHYFYSHKKDFIQAKVAVKKDQLVFDSEVKHGLCRQFVAIERQDFDPND